MQISKARLDTVEIDRRAVEPLSKSELEHTLQDMWRSDTGSHAGKLCIVRKAWSMFDGEAAVRTFVNEVISGRAAAIAPPPVVVRLKSPCTLRSFAERTASALGLPDQRRNRVASALEAIASILTRRRIRIVIFENMPADFGGQGVLDVVKVFLRQGRQIVCIVLKCVPDRSVREPIRRVGTNQRRVAQPIVVGRQKFASRKTKESRVDFLG